MLSRAALVAVLALAAPAQGAPGLRSAFVPVTVPSMPLTVVQGSLQNKPGSNGKCGGPLVGTAKQKKQLMKQMEVARAEAKAVKAERDAIKKAARDNDE